MLIAVKYVVWKIMYKYFIIKKQQRKQFVRQRSNPDLLL